MSPTPAERPDPLHVVMSSVLREDSDTGCCSRTGAKLGLKKILPAAAKPLVQAPACHEQSVSISVPPAGQGEEGRLCAKDGDVEEPLCPQHRGESPHPGVPGDPDEKMRGKLLGRRWTLHLRHVVALALALVLGALVGACVAASGKHEGNQCPPVAPALACPDEWVMHRNVCYYLSEEEGSWEWSRERCSSRGASLAVLQREWEMEFLSRLVGNVDYWLGLRRRGEHLEWLDGSSFNLTIPVYGPEPCVFFTPKDIRSSPCSQRRPYLCSKP